MKHQIALLVIVCLLSMGVYAETCGIAGDWLLEGKYEDRTFETILSISKDDEGNLGGYWISSWRMSELENVKFESDTLTFTQQFRMRDEQIESAFEGTVKDGTLTGTASSERGEWELSGKKMPSVNPVVGTWQFKRERQGEVRISTLTVTADEEGDLSATWKSNRGESEMSDVTFEDDTLSFKREFERNDRKMELDYKLSVEDNMLKGTMTTPRGEREIEGTLAGAELIGKWIVTRETERGERKQMLMVHPDMSGRYGSIPLEKVDFDTDTGEIAFKFTMSFGERSFDGEFSGKVDGDELSGEMTSSRGTSEVEGKKL